jgi:hypothetical protein
MYWFQFVESFYFRLFTFHFPLMDVLVMGSFSAERKSAPVQKFEGEKAGGQTSEQISVRITGCATIPPSSLRHIRPWKYAQLQAWCSCIIDTQNAYSSAASIIRA